MRRILGLDVNGWRDGAARDWTSEVEEASSAVDATWREGGSGGVVVKVGDHFVAGPQAILSPIGRGGGWGEIGDPRLRLPVRELWRSLIAGDSGGDFSERFQAVVDALSEGAEATLLVVPDIPKFDDERQQLLLDALAGRRRKPVRLLWRSVAMVLSAISDGQLDSGADGQSVLCVAHCSDGFEIQTLRLRRLSEHHNVLVPERAGPGDLHANAFGLETLLTIAERAFRNAHPALESVNDERPRLPIRALIEGVREGDTEILRLGFGRWFAARAPAFAPPAAVDMRAVIGTGRPEFVLFSSALNKVWREPFVRALEGATKGATVIDLGSDAAARGTLHAGRRIERGIPHYLDRLEPVSLIVMRGLEPELDDLVPANEIVPANREYVSKLITNLSWPGGADHVQFYLKKGEEFREWTVDGIAPPLRDQPLQLRLRQTPAQGRARLEANASGWDALRNRPIALDWSKLEAETRSFEQIAEELRPKPVIPERLVAFAHADAWGALGPGFLVRLERVNVERRESLDDLRRTLNRDYMLGADLPGPPTARRRYVRLLDYDGIAPADVSAFLIAALDNALHRIVRYLVLAARGLAEPPSNNAALLVTTYSFGRCPGDLQDCLLAAARAALVGGEHPFLSPPRAAKVILFGLGRVVTECSRLRIAFDLLAGYLTNYSALAALSMLLSRPKATPHALDEQSARRIAHELYGLLRGLRDRREYRTKLTYALSCVGGLLRFRERDPVALVARVSPQARELCEILREIRQDLEVTPHLSPPGWEKRLNLLSNMVAALEGGSRGVNILRDAEALEHDDESDDPEDSA